MRLENTFLAVDGVGEGTERKLWENGVTHWDAWNPGVVGATRADRIESFLADAREHLDDDDSAFFANALPSGELWRAYENFSGDAAFFDIETTGLSQRADDVTTVSVHRGGETATLVRGRDLDAPGLRDLLGDASLLVSFNGKRFDVPFLEASYDLDLATPHLDLMYPCRRLDLTGGLKAVEPAVGVDRDRPDISGRDAVRLWHQYEGGDPDALETLVSYNREDAVNLRALADAVSDRLHDRTLGALDESSSR